MLYLILAAVIWGSSFPVITYALRDVSPFLFLVLRFVLSFAILLPRYRKPDRIKMHGFPSHAERTLPDEARVMNVNLIRLSQFLSPDISVTVSRGRF